MPEQQDLLNFELQRHYNNQYSAVFVYRITQVFLLRRVIFILGVVFDLHIF